MYGMSGSVCLLWDSLGFVPFQCWLQPPATVKLATAAVAFTSKGSLFGGFCLKSKKETFLSGDCLVSELGPTITPKSLARGIEL